MLEKQPEFQDKYVKRREIVFLILAGIFIGTLAMLNIIGVTKLIDLSFTIFSITIPLKVFVGVLPYPVTFLCTDFISELYGKKRATNVVWVGLLINIWVVFILWIGGILPPNDSIDISLGSPDTANDSYVFYRIRYFTIIAATASMIAYLTAQLVDVHVFHFFRHLSKGKKLWLRNNGSTLTSQLVDSVAVITGTYLLTDQLIIPEHLSAIKYLLILIFSSYLFKMVAALLDTLPFYLGVNFLKKYLNLELYNEYKD